MSPILVRPVREQLEHDRVIRLLQAKYKRKFEVAINPGNQQLMPVGVGTSAWYPDLVLQSTERSRKLLGVVEVETAESVNHLEAMSQWVALSKLRAPFHLYVPSTSIDTARRLCVDFNVPVAEFWAYHSLGEQMRFTLVHKSDKSAPEPRVKAATAAAKGGNGAAKSGNGKPPAARAAARPAPRPKAGKGKAASGAAARRKPAATKSRGAAASRPRIAAKAAARPRPVAKKAASRPQKRK